MKYQWINDCYYIFTEEENTKGWKRPIGDKFWVKMTNKEVKKQLENEEALRPLSSLYDPHNDLDTYVRGIAISDDFHSEGLTVKGCKDYYPHTKLFMRAYSFRLHEFYFYNLLEYKDSRRECCRKCHKTVHKTDSPITIKISWGQRPLSYTFDWDLHEVYEDYCKKNSITPMGIMEFHEHVFPNTGCRWDNYGER